MLDYKKMITKWPLHWALGGNDFSGGLEQNSLELEKFCEFIDNNLIKRYVEVGIAAGYLLKFMRDEMSLDVFGITLEKRDSHIGLPVIYGLSQDPNIINQAPKADIYFIDADHSYEAVKQDYLNYKDKCNWMAFHDILGLRSCDGTRIFWSELKKEFEYFEFCHENLNVASGIGIIKIR